MNATEIKDGEIALITTDNGRIVQLAMTVEQHKTLSMVLSAMTQQSPLVKMGEEYDLVLKRTVRTYKKIHNE